MSINNNLTRQSIKKVETLLFDLDGTLYSANNGYIEHIRKQIFEFMYLKGFVPRSESAEAIWRPIFKKYNQTKRGLKAEGYKFDDDEYWTFHRKGMESYFKYDSNLRNVLLSFDQPKYILTNCNEKQAYEALDLLGVSDCFLKVFGASFMGDHCKPEKIVYEKVFKELNISDPSTVCLFEDSFKNLLSAKELGMSTVLVESMTAEEENVNESDRSLVDSVINSLSDLSCIEKLKNSINGL